jgi:hypothetical protein
MQTVVRVDVRNTTDCELRERKYERGYGPPQLRARAYWLTPLSSWAWQWSRPPLDTRSSSCSAANHLTVGSAPIENSSDDVDDREGSAASMMP